MFSKISQNSQENACVGVSILIKVIAALKKETQAQVFPCKFCKIFKNSFLRTPQHSKFASAVGKYRGFCRGASMFFSICLGKKNAEEIKCLGILKKYVAKNKTYFCFKKKRNVPLNKKVTLVFHTILKTLFHKANHLLHYPQMFVFSFYTFVVLIYQFLRNRT